jgi:hypothetical protein
MKKNNLKQVTAVVGSSMVMALAVGANASENPFQMVEFGESVNVAAEATDMQGNKVMIDDQTGFEYGGDQKAAYAGGKLATGSKDPAVCGTFAGESCSMPHLTKK